MADLFKNIKIKIEKVAGTTTKKANKIIDKTKLNLNLKMEEANLDECFEKLGKAFFRQVKSGVANDDKIAELIAEADKTEEKIDALKDELAKNFEAKKCAQCGKTLKNEKYCPNCGTKTDNASSNINEDISSSEANVSEE